MSFLPVSKQDMAERGWDQCDFVYVCGDAYVDHSSFGMAIITRTLEAHGYKVGVICQPDWKDPQSVRVLGEPRLGFMVSSGNMDSMVNHYTVAKRRRSKDFYSPGGVMGLRPDHATVVYSNLIRSQYKHAPIILGGIEASLRRLAHYDYWSNDLKRSILLDSGADLLIFGMGEKSVVEVADALDSGLPVSQLTWIHGTAYKTRNLADLDDPVILPTWEELRADKLNYARSFGIQSKNLDPFSAHTLVEGYPHDVYVVQNPPSMPLTTQEMDETYELPYERTYHPMYEGRGGIPAIKEVKFSIANNRGCLGQCSFCALNFHQGRIIQARSHESILAEARLMTKDPDFKGYINDIAGPTANFRIPACQKQLKAGACVNRRCLSPKPCPNLRVTHKDLVKLLRELRAIPGIKKVFIRSGIRFDYAMLDPDRSFIEEIAKYHTSGQLRLAPEHISDAVLEVMGKPSNDSYQAFCKEFYRISKQAGKEQYVLPYLMSSHPGSTMKEAVKLAEFCRDLGYNPEQVSDFYPTPSTVSTCIYYTGVDPRTMQEVYCPTNPHEKAMQRALIQYRNPKNYDLVVEALHRAHREDLIGYGPKCLVRPDGPHGPRHEGAKGKGPKRDAKGQKGTPGEKGKTPQRKRGKSGRPARGVGASHGTGTNPKQGIYAARGRHHGKKARGAGNGRAGRPQGGR